LVPLLAPLKVVNEALKQGVFAKSGHRRRNRYLNAFVMLSAKSLVCPPMHPLWLCRFRSAQDAMSPAQPCAYSACLSSGPVRKVLTLAGIGKALAMPTGKERAAIEQGDTPPASVRWANEPRALSAQIAGCVGYMDGVGMAGSAAIPSADLIA